MALSEELQKVDTFSQGVTFKLAQHIMDLLAEGKSEVRPSDALLVNGLNVESYLSAFRWDTAKFNTMTHIKDVTRDISKNVSEIENEMKAKIQAYSKVRGQLQAIDRKAK